MRDSFWGAGVVNCLEQGADNSMTYDAIFYSRLSVLKSIFMFP